MTSLGVEVPSQESVPACVRPAFLETIDSTAKKNIFLVKVAHDLRSDINKALDITRRLVAYLQFKAMEEKLKNHQNIPNY